MPSHQSPHRTLGIVLVITLLGVFVLAALVFYVVNMGKQVNARVATQNAADASVAAGATWVSRSFNLIAANNVGISRNLALVNVLDALPVATRAGLSEQRFLEEALSQRINGLSTSNSQLTGIARGEFQAALDELHDEVAMMEPASAFLNGGYDVSAMTHYNGPAGRGYLWRAMTSMDQLSQTTATNLRDLAHLSAQSYGESNLSRDSVRQASVMMLPLDWPFVVERGSFADWERPIRLGLLPEAVDDPYTNRGPYDTIFGWRGYRYRNGDVTQPPTTFGVSTDGSRSPFGGGPGNRGGSTNSIRIGYYTYGTHSFMIGVLSSFAQQYLRLSRWVSFVSDIANTKLRYLWDGQAPTSFAVPDWDASYPDDLSPSRTDPLPFSETAFFRLDIRSRYPLGQGGFLSAGSWTFDSDAIAHTPTHARVVIVRNWWLPNLNGSTRMLSPLQASQNNPSLTVQNAGPDSFVTQLAYTVSADPEIGIYPAYDRDGNIIPQPAYFLQVVIFAGVNRNPVPARTYPTSNPPAVNDEPIDPALHPEVVNPYDGFSPDSNDAPRPVDFDHSLMGTNTQVRQQSLTFLAVAQQDDHSPLWPNRFEGNKPYPYVVAMAQAEVFNNHSWDLWTQMWQSRLVPISNLEAWTQHLGDAVAGNVSLAPSVSSEQVEQMYQYFTSVQALGRDISQH